VNSEADLLTGARQFDQQALAEIYDLYSSGIYRYACRLLGNEVEAEECVGEVFSRFLSVLAAGGGPRDHLKAYLYRIAHNWITDEFRRQPPPELPLEADLIGQTDTNPSRLAALELERQQVRAALRLLTPEQRQVILLKYYEGFSNLETAAAMDKPLGAVKSLQHRALDALRRMLLQKEDVNEPVR
jgi:RNA polymerase sigma-70 factor (ECF subfamily)